VGMGVGITPTLSVDKVKTNKIVVKRVIGIENIPNKVYVQYRKNSLIEQPVKTRFIPLLTTN
jgi:LysR family transcriptional regulator, regulator of the ytmI operon